jgi:DNA-binding transcriptional ArsR family regulator
MAPDLLSTIQTEIAERMDGLRPLLAEHEQLLDAAKALEASHGEGKRADASTNGTPPRVPRAKGAVAVESFDAKRDVESDAESALKPASKAATRQPEKTTAAKPRAARGAAREAILAALEHGSHTVGELAVVTAMSGPNINGKLRRLAAEGVVVKTEREGKGAWALADTVA